MKTTKKAICTSDLREIRDRLDALDDYAYRLHCGISILNIMSQMTNEADLFPDDCAGALAGVSMLLADVETHMHDTIDNSIPKLTLPF